MKIKKIKDLSSEYEGYFIITDGLKCVESMCVSLPLPDNRIPKIGSLVSCLYAFFLDDNPTIKKLQRQSEHKYRLKKKGLLGMSYYVRGCILDSDKYLVKVFGFIISLEYLYGAEYCCSKKFDFANGDWISFTVNRFDVEI